MGGYSAVMPKSARDNGKRASQHAFQAGKPEKQAQKAARTEVAARVITNEFIANSSKPIYCDPTKPVGAMDARVTHATRAELANRIRRRYRSATVPELTPDCQAPGHSTAF